MSELLSTLVLEYSVWMYLTALYLAVASAVNIEASVEILYAII
jgi:hypothetical protein